MPDNKIDMFNCRSNKKVVHVPVIIVGGLRSIELMEEIVRNEEADLVSLSRPLIREPDLITRWKNGFRHRATCVSCNKCFEALLKREEFGCKILSQNNS
jgi:2,4-dienoyl-CoA reductase-like NADH-dependent reductase (Old Yellow Enzyme family)